jgi:integrase
LPAEIYDASCRCGRIAPGALAAVEFAREFPAERACGKIEADQLVALGRGENEISIAHDVRRDTTRVACSRLRGIFPAHFPGGQVKCIDAAVLGAVGADEQQAAVDQGVAMEADRPTILLSIVAPAWLPRLSQQAEWWIKAIEDGRVLHRGKRTRIRPATIAGYKSAIEWMSPHIGNMPLANIKNAAAKELVTAMKHAELSDKTIVNYIHVLQSVIASVVSGEGEQVHPRTWGSHFIGLPFVNPKKQNRPTRTAKELENFVAAVTGRYRVLYALLAGSGLRIGEALSIKIGPMSDDCSTISGECSTIYVRQAVWRGKEQDPKTPAGVRDVDIPKELAALLSEFVGDRKDGFLFRSASGKPLSPRNLLRDSLHPVLRKLKQPRAGFHCFRRFRESVLQMSDARIS